MLLKLRTRLVLFIVGGAIITIVLISVLINMRLFTEFDQYMIQEHDNKVQHLIEMIEQVYKVNDGWEAGALKNIELSAYIDEFDITIRDRNENVLMEKNMPTDTLREHQWMMGRIGRHRFFGNWHRRRHPHHHLRPEQLREENYVIDQYALIADDQIIGRLELGHIGPFAITERELAFTSGINYTIFYAAVISIFVAILIGFGITNRFSRPIIEMTEVANDMKKGKWDKKVATSNNTLELQQLSQSINHLSSSLREQEQLRKRLTSDISHELRTPLTILQSHVEAMRDGVWEPSKEKLDVCKNEVVRLIKLVDELKHLNHIESHELKLDLEHYNLSKDLNEVMQGFQSQIKEKSLELKVDIRSDITIQADRNKVRQIVINLLSNALKYTPEKGKIDIELQEAKENIIITIKDTGIGIEQKDIPYIFERMYRGDLSRNRKTGGTGIGLSISKRLVEAHGGSISVTSTHRKGTTFKVILPKNKS
ncbi:ATP-binding protein [Serpentinicella sp. ANB-PHB4]|uniref:sensor histidine kinase n=1 Tax=Serpentinicella sp. ANB-PHB4 TaxID=3074076 RepID=UPI002854A7E6|nr:ATP-binding protein [Serpentinicella sp. ANB-PHB4]MDR5659286.1 ATP-binding protein [Serpentinicella sp. ANB-PHB4]